MQVAHIFQWLASFYVRNKRVYFRLYSAKIIFMKLIWKKNI